VQGVLKTEKNGHITEKWLVKSFETLSG